MPLYTYGCPCGHVTEEIRKIDARNGPATCESCGGEAHLDVAPVAIDYLSMGVSRDFPTAWSKWETLQRAKNAGKQWDSNNRRYGGDWEKK